MQEGDKVTLELRRLEPEDAVLELMKIYNQAELESRGDVLDFVLRMAWNGGVADGRMIDLPPI